MLETPRARDFVPRQRSVRPADGSAIGPPPRHLAASSDPRELIIGTKRTPPTRRHGWHWLLVLPMTLPLLTPLYNRIDPAFWGIPFFYWYQLSCALVDSLVITFVYLVTKGKSR